MQTNKSTLIIVILVVIAGVVGFWFWQNRQATTNGSANNNSASDSGTPNFDLDVDVVNNQVQVDSKDYGQFNLAYTPTAAGRTGIMTLFEVKDQFVYILVEDEGVLDAKLLKIDMQSKQYVWQKDVDITNALFGQIVFENNKVILLGIDPTTDEQAKAEFDD